MMLILVLLGIILALLWYLRRNSTWDKRGVPGPKPLPIVGNILRHFLGQKTLGQIYRQIYNKYDKYPFVGIYRATTPCLLVRDPEFVQRILVKDFKSFQNNEMHVEKDVDVLFGRNPFVLRGKEWRDTRQMLSPGYTSGRMKNLYPMITEIAKTMVNFIENHPTGTTDGIETRLLTKRFTLDNVAKAAFGIDGKCFGSYDEMSDFMQLTNTFLQPGSFQAILTQMIQIFPVITKLPFMTFTNKSTADKIISIISEVKKHRLQNNVQANDYLQFLIELGKEHKFSDVDVTAHASTFFFDGYFTSSLVLSYLLLCLAMYPEYQDKVRDEIKETLEKNNGEIPYESLHDMPWLNACLYESTRVYPIAESMMKVCTEDFEYTPTDPSYKNLTVQLKPGDVVMVPYGIMSKDPKYFVEPDKFLPERLLEKDEMSNKVFFPFGAGPRVCIGQRMGIMQIKLGAAHIVKNFQISTSPKLCQPIKYCAYNFMNEVKGGIWLRYRKINDH
ncbi:putative cytochrome P450 28a5 [Rhynchophorus ferrugineus]|uniref:putative cytochrome P450 28a5 n=1 Tax=Rhynchophorus ferrugineus TaxID=354439 RepID=UPI003FCCFC01